MGVGGATHTTYHIPLSTYHIPHTTYHTPHTLFRFSFCSANGDALDTRHGDCDYVAIFCEGLGGWEGEEEGAPAISLFFCERERREVCCGARRTACGEPLFRGTVPYRVW